MDGGQPALPRHTNLFLLLGALAFAGAGCGPYIGTTAKSFLRVARESDDPNRRYLAYQKLGDTGAYSSPEDRAQAVQILSQALTSGREPLASRIAICRTLGVLGAPEARPTLVALVEDEDPLMRSAACRALGRVAAPEDATLLARVMTTDQSRDCRVAAIEAIGQLKAKDPRVLDKLVEGMKNPDPSIRLASYDALVSVSGTDLGPEPKPWGDWIASAAMNTPAPAVDSAPPATGSPLPAIVDSQTLPASTTPPPGR